MFRKLTSIFVVFVAIIAMSISQARADINGSSFSEKTRLFTLVNSSEDPMATFNSLTDTEKQEYLDSIRLHSTETKVTEASIDGVSVPLDSPDIPSLTNAKLGMKISGNFSGCWSRSTTSEGKSLVGITLVKYGQATEVCVRNSNVTSVRVFNVWEEVVALGWRITKSHSTSTYNVGWEGRGKAQWFFSLGINSWDIQNATPCLQLRLNKNGSHYQDTASCNLN